MNLNDLTLGQIKEIGSLLGKTTVVEDCPFEVGENYLIRTVTFTLTGKIKSKIGAFLVLQDADWITDTGRFSISLESDAIVAKGAIVDATKIVKLIRKMK